MLGISFLWLWKILAAGGIIAIIVSWISSLIPIVSNYKLPIQIIGILALVTGAWFLGEHHNEESWKSKVESLEKKLETAKVESDKVNSDLTASQKENEELRKKKNKEIIKYIDLWHTKEILKIVDGPERLRVEKVIQYIEQCPIPKEMLDIHNAAAKNEGVKK